LGPRSDPGFAIATVATAIPKRADCREPPDFHHEAKRDGINATPIFRIVGGIATGFCHVGNDGSGNIEAVHKARRMVEAIISRAFDDETLAEMLIDGRF
jgi:hypothetical protein